MLVLSRKQAERIQLGQSIRITVVAIERGRVRLGIEAPAQVSVVRGELLARESSGEGGVPGPAGRRPAPGVEGSLAPD